MRVSFAPPRLGADIFAQKPLPAPKVPRLGHLLMEGWNGAHSLVVTSNQRCKLPKTPAGFFQLFRKRKGGRSQQDVGDQCRVVNITTHAASR